MRNDKNTFLRPEDAAGHPDPQAEQVYDCAIIGAGPAGLSAAIYLGRLRRSVIVIDDKQGRSTWHQVNHNYLGFPDGVHATALREIGEEQASRYGVEFLDACAASVAMEGEDREVQFTVSTGKGDVVGRTLIFATGVTDRFPQFDGSDACIGKSMFWCIFCDGFEAIDKRVVVLGDDDHAASLALQLLVFTADVLLVSGEGRMEISEARRAALAEHGVAVYESSCKVYTCGREGELESVQLEDGTILPLDMLFVSQEILPNTELAKQLTVDLTRQGYIRTDTEQSTNIPGVYAAGDVTRLNAHQVTSAVHEGGMAAGAANYYLYEDWQKD